MFIGNHAHIDKPDPSRSLNELSTSRKENQKMKSEKDGDEIPDS